MGDTQAIRIHGATEAEFVTSYKQVLQGLPPELSAKLRKIRVDLNFSHGPGSTFKYFNGFTALEIGEKYFNKDVEPIATGEIGGMRYNLYDAKVNDSKVREV